MSIFDISYFKSVSGSEERGAFRIHKRHAIRQLSGRLVMVKDDGVHALGFEIGDFRDSGGATVDGNQQVRPVLPQASRDAVGAEAIAFVHPMR